LNENEIMKKNRSVVIEIAAAAAAVVVVVEVMEVKTTIMVHTPAHNAESEN
jgi:hypothetical protein